MSKTHLVVLGLVRQAPMYGYSIGRVLSSDAFSSFCGVKLNGIYKALQTLEQKGYLQGEQNTEGNAPPRMVYSITTAGETYFNKLIRSFLEEEQLSHQEFWLGLTFAEGIYNLPELMRLLEKRRLRLEKRLTLLCEAKHHEELPTGVKPLLHPYLILMENGMLDNELKVLERMRRDLDSDKFTGFVKER